MNNCSTNSKLIAQTLFLGSSVSSFNCNLGWSGQPSQLTVNLVDDIPKNRDNVGADRAKFPCLFDRQFPSSAGSFDTENYYYSCSGENDCYIDRDGSTWNTGNIGNKRQDGTTIYADDKLLPGKLYYEFSSNSNSTGVVSKYYYYPDPGFLGNPNRVSTNGTFSYTTGTVNSGYDIIGTPVYFKMGNFTFGGIVQSWEENYSSGGNQYKVNIEGMQTVLNNAYIIVGDYAGSIFSKNDNSTQYGAPRSYTGNTATHTGLMIEGNIPNVFNVYGFLESIAPENFGGANITEDGLSAKEILFGLRILTSSVENGGNRLKDRANSGHHSFGPKTSFSPYGRILVKSAQENYTFTPITTSFKKLGVIPPQTNLEDGSSYCEFLLDLSEIPNPPDDFRIKGPVVTISDFLNQTTEALGYDYTLELIPISPASRWFNVIKVKTISRKKQTTPNQISNTIKSLYASGYNITSSTIGKEKNESPARCMVIGGKQQRLLQAKAYRLGYTQCNIIFDARNRRFVDYIGLGKIVLTDSSISRTAVSSSYPNFSFGKIRFPSFLSTRNPDLAKLASPYFTGLMVDHETLRNSIEGVSFSSSDSIWPDKEIIGSSATDQRAGNYEKAKKGDHVASSDWGIKTTPSYLGITVRDVSYGGMKQIRKERYFPLYKDVIAPFFGYLMDHEYDIDTTKMTSSADFRRPRPVFFDTWTGQICVLFRASELPKTRVDLEGLYGGMSGLNRSASPFSVSSLKRTGGTTPPAPTPTPNPGGGGPPPGPPPGTPPGPSPTNTATTASPTVDNPAPANTTNFPSSGSQKEYFFIVTESEMRAAMMGPDEFLIYNCAKSYKTDLYLMMNDAYVKFYTARYTMQNGGDATAARQKAVDDCDWHWQLKQTNVSNQVLSASSVAPDKSSGAEVIPEDARKDFELIQRFIKGVADQYYGKRYMVQAPYLGAKRDMSFADISLPTSAGYAYVFRGDNKLKFSYEPTNQGAWEEYGNIIDDCIPVGGKDWHTLSDEQGLIRPIVGYNVTDRFDHVRYNLCLATIGKKPWDQSLNSMLSEANNYDQCEQFLINQNYSSCDPSGFIFPSIDINTLTDPTRYVVIQAQQSNSSLSYTAETSNFSHFNSGIFTSSCVSEPNAFGVTTGFCRKKLYHLADVEEKFAFLNPETLQEPKIIIMAPGISINSTSQEFQKDPNSTVLATVAVEDASVYLRSNNPSSWDADFLAMLSAYVENAGPKGYLFGSYASISKNSTAQNVMLKPKMVHPFFAGIPIRSNQYCYGPWTNYPYYDYPSDKDDIFPSATIVNLDYTVFPLSSTTGTVTYTDTQIKNAINNWIYPTKVYVNPDFVPWNYGGMSYLDDVALREVKSQINYQPIIETASVDMAGLPLFNLGGSFNDQILNNVPSIDGFYYDEFKITEHKRTTDPLSSAMSLVDANQLNYINSLTYNSGDLKYNVIRLPYKADALSGPIVSTIGVDIGSNGIKTTYMFRTYTRKLSLFNKEYADKIKRFAKENLSRQKEVAKINQQIANRVNNENLTMLEQKSNAAPTQIGSFTSKLISWSPVEVIVASAGGFLKEPIRNPAYIEQYNSQTMPSGSTSASSSATYSIPSDNDLGTSDMFADGFSDATAQLPSLANRGRIRTTAQIYQRTELGDFLRKDYGTKSVMSLDGIFSPVSFYPTNNLSTFAFSKYHKSTCPVCRSTGKRTLLYKKFANGSVTTSTGTYEVLCNACCDNHQKLNSALDYSSKTQSPYGEKLPPYVVTSGSDFSAMTAFAKNIPVAKGRIGQNIPINLVSLQPLIVPYHEFKNPNTQNYTGEHPDGYHPVLSLNSKNRKFIDRSRHSIGIVGRSAVHQNSIEIHNNLDNSKFLLTYPTGSTNKYQADFFYRDIALNKNMKTLANDNVDYEMNQRFIGLRGPIVMHAWGYDTEGYPVPNASDEPLEVDQYNRPKRFKLTRTLDSATTWEKLSVGDVFVVVGAENKNQEMVKALNLTVQNTMGNYIGSTITNQTSVKLVTYRDDLTDSGGFDPATYDGSIISKTQKWISNKWTPKLKLKEFYLNWGERPDTWPVGPIDLRWDAGRRVWTANSSTTYKMMYVTLEEDLTRHKDLDETYPARGFLDDVDFSAQPMPVGARRLVFVKDRCGYTAPRGAKILCRYDGESGFYEPISKPTYIVKGSLVSGTNQASIEMSYVQGKKKGENYPTMVVAYENPFGLPTAGGAGLFTYINGKWTLTTSK